MFVKECESTCDFLGGRVTAGLCCKAEWGRLRPLLEQKMTEYWVTGFWRALGKEPRCRASLSPGTLRSLEQSLVCLTWGVALPGFWEASRPSPQGVPSLPTPASSPPSGCPPKAEPRTDPPVPPPAARLRVASEQELLSSAAPAPAPSWKPRPACHCHKRPEPVVQQPAGFIGFPGPPSPFCSVPATASLQGQR